MRGDNSPRRCQRGDRDKRGVTKRGRKTAATEGTAEGKRKEGVEIGGEENWAIGVFFFYGL